MIGVEFEMSNFLITIILHGMIFDYLGLVIAILSIIQIVWGFFVRK